MIENAWQEAPLEAAPLLALARAHGWRNLPVCLNDVRVAWKEEPVDAPGGAMLRRHLPVAPEYTAVAPSFAALVDALAWEAHEWVAVEAWRARGKPNPTHERPRIAAGSVFMAGVTGRAERQIGHWDGGGQARISLGHLRQRPKGRVPGRDRARRTRRKLRLPAGSNEFVRADALVGPAARAVGGGRCIWRHGIENRWASSA